MIVYCVPDDDADNGSGMVFHATQKDAFEHARELSRSRWSDDWTQTDEERAQGREVRVDKIWLVKPTKKGCLAMLNLLWYAQDSKTVATFFRGRRIASRSE